MQREGGGELFTETIVKLTEGQQVIKDGHIFRRKTIFIQVPTPGMVWAKRARGIVLKSRASCFIERSLVKEEKCYFCRKKIILFCRILSRLFLSLFYSMSDAMSS